VNEQQGARGQAGAGRPGAPACRARRGPGRWAGLAGALAALGAVLVVTGVLAQETPPAPARDLGSIPAPARAAATPGIRALPRSRPVSLAIPAIGVRASLIDLGLTADGGLQVPPLTAAGVREAGWYDRGPAPGQAGPAVIAGHVDSYAGPGVFFRLGALRPGDQVDVTRADGITAVFRVDAVEEVSKAAFPARQVYGPVSYAGLRVITCGGQFDDQTRHYLSSIVIYAALAGSRRA
jgi:hypothetical protein